MVKKIIVGGICSRGSPIYLGWLLGFDAERKRDIENKREA